jgi:ABC-type transporter Mla subunit MlaD
MTDAITAALGDLDTAISGISSELATVVEQVRVLQQQLAAGNTTDAATLAAEIEQRVSTIQQSTASAQSALTTAGSPTGGGTTNPPPSPEPVAQPADTLDTSTPPGSSMG